MSDTLSQPGFAVAAPPALEPLWHLSLDDYVAQLLWRPDGQRVLGLSTSGEAVLADASGREIRRWQAHTLGALSGGWSAQGTWFATGGQDGRLCVYAAQTGDLLASVEAGGAWVEHLAWSPTSEQLLLTTAGRSLRLWEVTAQGVVLRQSWAEQPHTLSGLAWHPNLTGQFATTSYSELVRWKVGQQEAARRFRWKGSLLGLSWSPDARYIATATQDATVHIWEAKTGQDMEMAGYATKVQSLSWSADGRYLATDGSTDVAVWDCGGKGPAGREPLLLNGHEGVIRALAFAPKAAWVASGCQLGDLCVWDLVAKKPLYTAIQDNAFSCLRWKPDASIVISGDCLGQVTAWSLPIHKTTI